jgi:hypothetical protein
MKIVTHPFLIAYLSSVGTFVFAADGPDPSREFDSTLEFTYFEPTDSQIEGSLGVKYSFEHGIKLNDPLIAGTERPRPIGSYINFYNVNLFAKGNAPFKDDYPVNNFLETGTQIEWVKTRADVVSVVCQTDFCDERTPTNSFNIKFAGSYQFESDSKFDKRQHAYGLKLRFAYKVAGDSKLQYINPLEWGPSLIKKLIGTSERNIGSNRSLAAFEPFASPWLPSFTIAAEEVDPSKDDKRKVADPKLNKFNRLRAEVGYSSDLFKVGEDIYRTSVSLRYYEEIDPSSAIKTAGLDSFKYYTFSIHTPQQVVISYAKGQLPFDLASESQYQIGWDFNF